MVFPNDSSGNGVAYDIPATMKIDVTGDRATNHTPDKEILIDPCSVSVNADKTTARYTPVMKLNLNNMKIGGDPVYISDYSISCDTEGIKVKNPDARSWRAYIFQYDLRYGSFARQSKRY